MGFLKKIFIPFILSLVLVQQGCSISIISIPVNQSEGNYAMFGENAQRNFFVPQTVSDSLVSLWENDGNGAFANTSVTICDSIVFVSDLSGRVYAYNFYNGKELGQIKNKGAVYGAPVIKDFWIIFAVASLDDNESTLYFYDFSTGKTFREEIIPGRVLTELVKTKDGFVLATEDGRVQKIDDYGLPKWDINLDSFIHSSPVYKDGIVLIGNDKGEITAINSNDGKILYKKSIGSLFLSGGTIKGSMAYYGNNDGYIYAFDYKTGNLSWKFNSGARILMTPACDNNFIYVGNLNGDLYCLDKNTGTEKWKYKSAGLFNVSPLITNNLIFIPDMDKKMHLVYRSSGKLDKIIQLEGRGKLTPVLFKNILFIGYDRGVIQAYEFK
jgi:outer membrane protein assembly factor BamB